MIYFFFRNIIHGLIEHCVWWEFDQHTDKPIQRATIIKTYLQFQFIFQALKIADVVLFWLKNGEFYNFEDF